MLCSILCALAIAYFRGVEHGLGAFWMLDPVRRLTINPSLCSCTIPPFSVFMCCHAADSSFLVPFSFFPFIVIYRITCSHLFLISPQPPLLSFPTGCYHTFGKYAVQLSSYCLIAFFPDHWCGPFVCNINQCLICCLIPFLAFCSTSLSI